MGSHPWMRLGTKFPHFPVVWVMKDANLSAEDKVATGIRTRVFAWHCALRYLTLWRRPYKVSNKVNKAWYKQSKEQNEKRSEEQSQGKSLKHLHMTWANTKAIFGMREDGSALHFTMLD